MQLPQPRRISISEAANYVADRCGVSEEAAKADLEEAFREFGIYVLDQDGKKIEEWKDLEINWPENRIERPSAYVSYTFEGCRVYRERVDDWLEKSVTRPKRAIPPAVATLEPEQPEGTAHAVTAPQTTSSKTRINEDAAGNSADAVARLVEWIFVRHPRDGGEPMTRDQLISGARKAGLRFATEKFNEAYGAVYESKNNRPTKGGWPLKEPYRSRLAQNKK
jgi:hypothetical protein